MRSALEVEVVATVACQVVRPGHWCVLVQRAVVFGLWVEHGGGADRREKVLGDLRHRVLRVDHVPHPARGELDARPLQLSSPGTIRARLEAGGRPFGRRGRVGPRRVGSGSVQEISTC